MKYQVNAYTTKFFKKDLNEDSILVNDCVISDGYFQKMCDLDEFTYAVCDGVSGSDKGYYASAYVLQSIVNNDYSSKEDFKHLLYDINHNFHEVGQRINSHDLSTTFAGIYFNEQMNFFAVGDSRIYKVKDNNVTQITNDDTVAYQLFRDGVIKEHEIENHPQKNVLTNYFGNNDEQFKVQVYEDSDFANATYFIMSDGISDYVPKERLYELMTKNVDGFDLIRLIVGEAMNQGSSDDTSIIILEVS